METKLVIEHIDEELFEWTKKEYQHIVSLSPWKVWITNLGQLVQETSNLYPQVETSSESIAHMDLPKESVCFFDMRAEKTLTTEDNFEYLVVGGVLGDHPPRDRAKYLREQGYQLRNLGAGQMATDIAVLAVKMILHNKVPLEAIPFQVDPEIEFENENCKETLEMTGFKYILDENGRIILAEGLLPIMAQDFLEE